MIRRTLSEQMHQLVIENARSVATNMVTMPVGSKSAPMIRIVKPNPDSADRPSGREQVMRTGSRLQTELANVRSWENDITH